MNGSVVIAKIAGTLSTAKITSAISISASATKSGVMNSVVRPGRFGSGRRTKNRSPWCSSTTLKQRFMKRSTGLLPTSYSVSANISILMPVAIRNTAKR